MSPDRLFNIAWKCFLTEKYDAAIKLFNKLKQDFPYLGDAINYNVNLINNRKSIRKCKKALPTPRISVIIPVFNNFIFLEECLDSVINQSLRDIEIIIINDGSDDERTNALLFEYDRKYQNIILFNKANAGYGQSINTGFAIASGNYIGIVESDDFIEPEMYERLHFHARKYDCDIVKCNFSRFITRNDSKVYQPVNIYEDKLYNRVIYPKSSPWILRMYTLNQNGIYKKELIEKNCIKLNETPGALYQDNGLFFQLLMNATSIYCIKDSLYNLRRDNPGSSCFSRKNMNAESNEYKFIKDIIFKNSELKQFFKDIFFQKKYHNFQSCLDRLSSEYKKEFFDIFYNEFKNSLENNEFSKTSFDDNEWNGIQKILNKKYTYFKYRITHPQKYGISFD